MNDELSRRFVRDLVEDLQQVSGASLEKLLKPIWEKMAGGAVQTNGLNLQGAPVSGALDGLWPDGSAAEASSDKDFFSHKEKKLRQDIRHIRKAAPHICHFRMFSTRLSTPSARTRQDKRQARYGARGFKIEVYAAQDIAEYLVHECLLDEVITKRIAPILPNLLRITEQHAASQRLPNLDPAFRGRESEAEAIKTLLENERCVVISGLGGIGKTEFVCAVAHSIRDQYEQVLWIDASTLERSEQLSAFDVRSNGYELNVLGILRSQSALVILDNVTVDLDLDTLASKCGVNSRVMLTSQAKWGRAPFLLEELHHEDAAAILSTGVVMACPKSIVEYVIDAVGAHPLLLRILNRLMLETEMKWHELVDECSHLPSAIDGRRQTVAQRIVCRNLSALGSQLAPFLWAQSSVLEFGLAKQLIGNIGLSKLERWAFLARSENTAVRLHDIVYACSVALLKEIAINQKLFRAGVESYLRSIVDPKGTDFIRVTHRHSHLFSRLLAEHPSFGIVHYAYLHSDIARNLDPILIGDPSDVLKIPHGSIREWVLSVVEAIEVSYRHTRDCGEKELAKQELRGRLSVFDKLEVIPSLDRKSVTTVRHHRAKSLVKLGDVDFARQEFEAITMDEPEAYPSKLQLARLLTDDPDRAKALIFQIIEAAQHAPGTVQITTLIETLATLRRRHLHAANREMTQRFGPFMAQMIKAAAWTGEAQPVHAFAAVGPDWSYTEPNLFREVFEEIELGSPNTSEDDDERIAVGRICVAAAKMYLRLEKGVEAETALNRAIEFFDALRAVSPFAAPHFAEALLLAGNPIKAGTVLDSVPENRREAFWCLRRAKAMGETDVIRAVELIDQGIALNTFSKYRATFLSTKADFLYTAGESAAFDVLKSAIQCCEEDKFRSELQDRLNDWLEAGKGAKIN